MDFIFDRKTSLLNLVMEDARHMDKPSLLICSFHIPDDAAHRLVRYIKEGLFDKVSIYSELRHRNNKGWQVSLRRLGVDLYAIPIHAKCAILQDNGKVVVFLSSNNWINNHVYEFSARYEGDEAVQIADQITAALPSCDADLA